jgi:hypothetical protein
MVTVLRAQGLRVVIFSNDHQPAHVHVFGDGQTKANPLGADGAPELIWADVLSRGEVRRAMRLVSEQRVFCWFDGRTSMSELTDAAVDSALERGRIARLYEPRAAAARYDREHERIVVELTNSCTFAFPPHLAQGLENATADQLAQVEILGPEYGLHWEALDVDLAVPDLLAGLFGTRSYMARRAGRASSPAKAAAARANGAKGGRPRKSA